MYAGAASADGPPPIRDNHYAIELWQGPLLAPIHVTGVGGAYVASAEGTEGAAVNAAAPAVRVPYSTTWFDYDLSAGFSLPGAFTRTDFDNHGDFANLPSHARAGDFVDLTVGATLQFGALGVAATGDLQQFSLATPSPGPPDLTMQVGRWKALCAYGFLGGQLAVGGGLRVLSMQIRENSGSVLLTMTGVAPEVGALLMPTGRPWRVGGALRAAVTGAIFGSENVTVDRGVKSAGSFVLPGEVVMPWEVELGLAYQLGPRPLNPGWEDPREQEAPLRIRIREDRAERARKRIEERGQETFDASAEAGLDADEARRRRIEDYDLDADGERLHRVRKARYANWPRERILVLASVLLTGPTDQAIPLEGFLDQRVETVGRSMSATPRLGLEGEPLRDRVVVRAGTYVEPSRYDGGAPRQHFVFGGDVRLFPLDFWGLLPGANWMLTMALDIAPRYTSSGIGVGIWH